MIEMLVVMAILALLAGLLLPALTAARRSARNTRARTECNQIETAWKQYFNDYRHFPGNITEMDETAMKHLTGELNPRRRRYMESPGRGETGFKDPWGHLYQVRLNAGFSTQYENHPELINRSVIVWSRGPHNDPLKTNEHIRSWQ